MRERWARWLAILTGLLVLLLAAAFAWLQNPPPAPPAEQRQSAIAATADPQQVERGRQAFDSNGCLRCHSVAGHGSPRSPLDDVAARLDAAELRQWMLGDPEIADGLTRRALEAKQAYHALPAAEIDALLGYLETLR
jgi:nitric oxide reductase large subunit